MKRSPDLITWLRRKLSFRKKPQQGVQDNFFNPGEAAASFRDRSLADYRVTIEKSMNAWRNDALARRIVNLTTQFSVGRGFRIGADDPAADAFLHEFWENPLNRMDVRLNEWSDELCRTGNLFIMLSSDSSGMSYVRAIPAGLIDEIVPMENDIEQPQLFRMREITDPVRLNVPEEKIVRPASLTEPVSEESMLHFTVNRPIGGQWGESDLAPLLPWLEKYHDWLCDRWMLNHFRSSFVYVVKSSEMNAQEREVRSQQLNRTYPEPGTIYVVGKDEDWSVINPNLESSDANEDGMAIKKMIAAGAGIPISFLSEPGSVSRAESGGMEDSACRGFRQRQQVLLWITETVLRHVLARGALVRRGLCRDCEIHVYGDDIAAPGMTEGGMVR